MSIASTRADFRSPRIEYLQLRVQTLSFLSYLRQPLAVSQAWQDHLGDSGDLEIVCLWL